MYAEWPPVRRLPNLNVTVVGCWDRNSKPSPGGLSERGKQRLDSSTDPRPKENRAIWPGMGWPNNRSEPPSLAQPAEFAASIVFEGNLVGVSSPHNRTTQWISRANLAGACRLTNRLRQVSFRHFTYRTIS